MSAPAAASAPLPTSTSLVASRLVATWRRRCVIARRQHSCCPDPGSLANSSCSERTTGSEADLVWTHDRHEHGLVDSLGLRRRQVDDGSSGDREGTGGKQAAAVVVGVVLRVETLLEGVRDPGLRHPALDVVIVDLLL